MGIFGGGFNPIGSGLKILFDDDDKRKKIEKHRRKAKKKLREAESLRDNELVPLQKSLKRKAEQISQAYSQQIQYKQNLLKEINGDISETVAKFKTFNIDIHVMQEPALSNQSNGINFDGGMMGTGVLPMNNAPSILSLLGSSNDDLDDAKEAHAKAKRYLLQIEEAIEQLRSVEIHLETLEKCMQDEKEELTELMSKLRKIMKQLQQAMKRDTFSRDEAEYMKAICGIGEIIKDSMSTQIINDGGILEEHYQEYLRKLRNINDSIPETPVLKTGRSWLQQLAEQVRIYES